MNEQFEHTTAEQWRELIREELKDIPYESLRWSIADGVNGRPDFHRDDAPKPTVFIPENRSEVGWHIKESLSIDTFDKSNKVALKRLMMGVNALHFKGLINRDDDLDTLLTDIELPFIAVFFDQQNQPLQFLEYFYEYVKSKQFAFEKIVGGMSYDPIGTLALRGNWINNEIRDRETCVDLLRFCYENNLPHFNPVLIDATVYHNSGADVVWELACALAHGNEYLHWMRDAELDVKKAGQQLHFTFSSGRHYYAHIAKLRAFRPLWANVCEANGIDPQDAGSVYVSAETSWREMSPRDPHTNLIRTTTQSLAAVIGGCNAVEVLAFDVATDQSISGNRLARNIQLILNEEALAGKVSDVAAGSYLFDQLSTDIMEKAWTVFKEIENQGGLLNALKEGWLQEKIEQQAAAEDEKIASGAAVYVGLNKYLNNAAKEKDHREQEASGVMESKQVEPLTPRPAAQAVESTQPTSAS